MVYPLITLRGLSVFPDMFIHFDVGRPKSVGALEAAMNKDQMIEALRKSIDRCGVEIINNSRRLQAILNDFLPGNGYAKERKALLDGCPFTTALRCFGPRCHLISAEIVRVSRSRHYALHRAICAYDRGGIPGNF